MKFLLASILVYSSSGLAQDALVKAGDMGLFSFDKGKLTLQELTKHTNTSTYEIKPAPTGKIEIDGLNRQLGLISASKTPIKMYKGEQTTLKEIQSAYNWALQTASKDVLRMHIDQLMRDIKKLENESTCNPAAKTLIESGSK
ncbi:MAG: hypothetical protein AABY64_10200 [Bdellovibrionota bacterium]